MRSIIFKCHFSQPSLGPVESLWNQFSLQIRAIQIHHIIIVCSVARKKSQRVYEVFRAKEVSAEPNTPDVVSRTNLGWFGGALLQKPISVSAAPE